MWNIREFVYILKWNNQTSYEDDRWKFQDKQKIEFNFPYNL